MPTQAVASPPLFARRPSKAPSVRAFKGIICEIAVGTLITERPPHRTEWAPFGHSAPTSGI
jgi:hypothetical protein